MKVLTDREANDFIDRWSKDAWSVPLEMYITENDGTWTAIDNSQGWCFTADFETKEEAILYNIGYLDSDGEIADRQKLFADFVKALSHINSFECDRAKDVYKDLGIYEDASLV